jgi:PAS domain S-box-containing protein
MTKARIVIAEDERVVALDMQDQLTRLGYAVVGNTPLGEEAVRLAEDLRPDLVLMDISLAGDMDGISAALEIHKRGQVPVIYLTAYADEDTIERARLAEPYGYLLKPFQERELRAVIELALYKRVAELKIKLAEEKYRSIFENAVEGIFQSTPDGKFLAANPAMARLAGYASPDEMIAAGNYVHQQSFVSPDRRREYNRLLAEQGYVQGFEFEAYRKDGSKHWVAEHTRSVHNDRGDLLYYEGAVEDITQRKRLEDEFRQAHKMEAIGQLAGGVAHDFNNLMTVILACSDIVLRKMLPEDPTRSFLLDIQKAGERATALTRQLLAFSRKQMLTPKVLDLNRQIYELETLFRRLIGEHIYFAIQLDPALGRVEADPGQMEQIVLNLIVNARDAMPRGGELTIATANVDITNADALDVPGLQAGPYVRLTVRDTGCGMTHEIKARLFEPFFTTKELGKGTGLGLATVYGIVKQSGGHIQVQSEPGRGTRFDVFLPRKIGDGATGSDERTLYMPHGGEETILFVEDEDSVRKVAAAILEEAGYTVLRAGDAQEAIRITEEHHGRIDLLLTDMVMPGMNGRDLAAQLVASHPGLKVLYTSGYSEHLTSTPVASGTPSNMMNKPFTPRILVRRVREALDL